MNILAIDDEYLALEGLTDSIRQCAPEASIKSFRDSDEAIDSLTDFVPDIAFLDIELRTQNGVEIAKKIIRTNPKVNIIFVTGYSQYMRDAFDMHASGYIQKPITTEKIRHEMENLRYSVEKEKVLRAKTFGDFGLFADDIPISFSYVKSLELIAFLIDANGSLCSTEKIISALWEDCGTSQHKSYLRNLVSDIRHTLKSFGCDDILISLRGFLGINKTKIKCDLFDYLEHDSAAIDSFNEEYMNQYSWAEPTLGALMNGSL